MKNLFPRFIAPSIILVIFLFDRITKEWIKNKMFLGEVLEIFPFFNITYVRNTGVAFGLGQNNNLFFIFLSSILLLILFAFLVYWEKMKNSDLKLKIALGLIIGGALGNLFDRFLYGSVIDFLDFFVGSYHWPSFNVADSSICVGAFLLALSQMKPNSVLENGI
ncbi:MAG: signal peptidase II [Elusimicrobia bacterium]|nr:signal peptidase II [Elusimicrobiota bacterium]